MQKCSQCGVLTSSSTPCSKCGDEQLELDYEREQFRFAARPLEQVNNQPQLDKLARASTLQSKQEKKPEAKATSDFVPLRTDPLNELIELQKTQNAYSKSIAQATTGIFVMLTLAAIGAFAFWFLVAVVGLNS